MKGEAALKPGGGGQGKALPGKALEDREAEPTALTAWNPQPQGLLREGQGAEEFQCSPLGISVDESALSCYFPGY